jgi:uncharacterized protein
MDDETLELLVKNTLSYSNGGTASFSWQGGEPLLSGVDFFKRVIELQKKYGISGQRVGNSVQTNATLMTKQFAFLFKQYNVLLGISLDGPRKIHNYHRDKSFDKVMNSINLLKEENVEFNVLTVVNNINSKKPDELYEFFLNNELYYLQFIPCMETDNNGNVLPFSVTPEDYGAFLCRLFDLWFNNGNPQMSVRFFENALEAAAGLSPSFCEFKATCGQYLLVEHNGDVYPCDFFANKDLLLGNIKTDPIEVLLSRNLDIFGKKKLNLHNDCLSCGYKYICNGGCLKYRKTSDGSFFKKDYFCLSYIMFFDYALPILKKYVAKVYSNNIYRQSNI